MLFIFVRYGKIQQTFNEQVVRLKAYTLFIERVLYFPISHSNGHRLHIVTYYFDDKLCYVRGLTTSQCKIMRDNINNRPYHKRGTVINNDLYNLRHNHRGIITQSQQRGCPISLNNSGVVRSVRINIHEESDAWLLVMIILTYSDI